MKRLTIIVFVASLFAGSLFADGHNMNYHIHEGKMMNHKHPDFYPDHSKVPAEGEVKWDPNYWNNQTNMNAIYAIQVKNGVIK